MNNFVGQEDQHLVDFQVMEIKQHVQVGSDVEGTINSDHALAAEEFLKQAHLEDKWQVVVADEKTLMLDYDDYPYDATLPEKFYLTLSILEQRMGIYQQFFVYESKGGNTHAKVILSEALPIAERIAWQAAFGSDPKREALHLLSVSRGELNPILLFMAKPQEQKLLGDGNVC